MESTVFFTISTTMHHWWVILVLVCCSCVGGTTEVVTPTRTKLPIVYVYTVVSAVCKHGLPGYIKESLEQAIQTQPDCDVILVSNFAECSEIEKTVEKVPHLIKVDSTLIASNRTMHYKNVSKEIFMQDYGNELWITSALRFLIMEDIMIHYGYKEMMHVEADNLLYGKLTTILPTLRAHYRLAATPLTINKSFITASVFWIGNFQSLVKFNDYLLGMGNQNGTEWKGYLKWLRQYACCKHGGYDPDENGYGIKPFAINEMSMLGYYHVMNPLDFKLFPVVATYDKYPSVRAISNMSTFAPNGEYVGPATGNGIWDPNSWGQFLGGTSRKKGRDKQFVDGSHIAGQSMWIGGCRVTMECGNQSTITHQSPMADLASYALTGCYTAPHVICGRNNESDPDLSAVFTPLWNLHVHSKHTQEFRSVPCNCIK